MMIRISTTAMLKSAGLFTWACVGVALLVTPWFIDEAERISRNAMIGSVAAQALFGFAYWRLTSQMERSDSGSLNIILLAVITLCALVVSDLSKTGLGGILLLIVAGVLPWVLGLMQGMIWLVAQNILLALVFYPLSEGSLTRALVISGLALGYSSFAFVASYVARRQMLARNELRKVNSELRATQALLAESTRIAERVRISRELHDLVGHHLTALSLNLEVANHLVTGKAQDHVSQAQSVAKLLLSDVREVVNSMRADDSLDLTQALKSLSEGVPEPRIHLSIPDELTIDDPKRAQIVLRITQEIITNSVKHAHADNLWLAIDQDENGLMIEARDDGLGTNQLKEGNGLLGMGERLRQFDGSLSVRSAQGQGFSLKAWLPKEVSL